MNPSDKNFQDAFIKALAAVGLLAILVGGLWAITSLVKSINRGSDGASSFWQSITSRPAEPQNFTISVSPAGVTSGERVMLSWPTVSGTGATYSFSYTCASDVRLEAGGSTLPCDVNNTVYPENGSITLTPRYSGSATVSVPVKMTVTTTNPERTYNGTGTITVNPTKVTVPSSGGPVKGGNATGGRVVRVYPDGQYPTRLHGKADLVVRIIDTGTLDKDTNRFTSSTSFIGNERTAVKFEIVNIGTNATGVWSFNAVFKQFGVNVWGSDMQPSLNPGDKIEYVLGFDGIYADRMGGDTSTITINADPDNRVNESNEDNNLQKRVVHIRYQ